MRYSTFFFLPLLLTLSYLSNSQNIKVHPKFFTLHNSRFSLGVGLESGITPGFMINASKPANLHVVYKDVRNSDNNLPYASYGLVFDLYSANSLIGLLSGVDFSRFIFGLQKGDSTTDLMDISRIEIPLYLKFRLGKIDGKRHAWLLLGGVYNLSQSCKREQFNAKLGVNAYTTVFDDNKDQVKNYFGLAGSIGYEFFIGSQKHFRMAIYSKIAYPISNQLNSEYTQFKASGNSILRGYPNFDIREYRISIGFKFLLQFGEAATMLLHGATKNASN